MALAAETTIKPHPGLRDDLKLLTLPLTMWNTAQLDDRPLLGFNDQPKQDYGTAHGQEKSPTCVNLQLAPDDSHSLPESWMSRLPDGLPVSALTIPGTHDSAAYTYPMPFVATQTMDITQQLNAGIRYFDLRCGLRDDIVEMVHGPTYLSRRLDEILRQMYDWLATHPTEGLIVQIKKDRPSSNSTQDFSHAVASALSAHSSYWRTANTPPPLGELRGRIQLFRRFVGPANLQAYGIDVSQWEDNPWEPFTIYTDHSTQLMVQDHYSWPGPTGLPSLIAEKGGAVASLLNSAAEDLDVHHWYLNFTSAYEFNLYYQLPPKEIAVGGYWGFRWEEGVNVRLRNWLDAKAGGRRGGERRRYGIVAMDFPEAKAAEDLVLRVILTNFERTGGGGVGSVWDVVCFWVPMVAVLVMVGTAPMWLLP